MNTRREYCWSERRWYVVSPIGRTVALVQGPPPTYSYHDETPIKLEAPALDGKTWYLENASQQVKLFSYITHAAECAWRTGWCTCGAMAKAAP